MAGRGSGPDFVESLARGLDVLACFDARHGPHGLEQIRVAKRGEQAGIEHRHRGADLGLRNFAGGCRDDHMLLERSDAQGNLNHRAGASTDVHRVRALRLKTGRGHIDLIASFRQTLEDNASASVARAGGDALSVACQRHRGGGYRTAELIDNRRVQGRIGRGGLA